MLPPTRLLKALARAALALLVAVPLLAAPDKPHAKPAPAAEPTLRQYADQLGFHIGTTMQVKIFNDPRYREVLGREFNTFVSFTLMRITEPERDRFDLSPIDRDVQFARQHQMKLFGASLVYRIGVAAPYWLTERRLGGFTWSKEDLDSILKNYIEGIVRYGDDSYYAWEVVDEPVSNPNQPWQWTFGQVGYISKAFRYARESNRSAALVLNETFGPAGIDRAKADRYFDLVKRLKGQGVPIDVAGTELHLEAQQLRPTYLDELRYFLSRARSLGLQVYITEMDLYQGSPGAFPNPLEHQRQVYHDVLATCLADSSCKTFIVWGVSDARTWLREKQNNPRPDAEPLLFDGEYQKKPAYFGVLQALQERVAAMKGYGGAQHAGR